MLFFVRLLTQRLIECLKLLKELFDVKVKDIEKGSIKFILEGSEERLDDIVKLFRSGVLTALLKQRFNLEIEDAKFINSDSSEDYQKNQSQKLLAFTVAGDANQADIDILKAALIDTSDDDENVKNEEKSRLIKEIRNQGAEGLNLSGANLSDADLSDANLRGANLSDANLRGANLSGANLSSANLSDANLIRSYLRGANLIRANLRGANLIRANLSGANLSGANLSSAYLSDANPIGANLNFADLSGVNLRGANLNFADLNFADLSGADLKGADLSGANLNFADLSGADLKGADMRGADLSGANVKNACFAYSSGILESLKQDLIERGAIFEDSPGDHSEVYSPTPTRV